MKKGKVCCFFWCKKEKSAMLAVQTSSAVQSGSSWLLLELLSSRASKLTSLFLLSFLSDVLLCILLSWAFRLRAPPRACVSELCVFCVFPSLLSCTSSLALCLSLSLAVMGLSSVLWPLESIIQSVNRLHLRVLQPLNQNDWLPGTKGSYRKILGPNGPVCVCEKQEMSLQEQSTAQPDYSLTLWPVDLNFKLKGPMTLNVL